MNQAELYEKILDQIEKTRYKKPIKTNKCCDDIYFIDTGEGFIVCSSCGTASKEKIFDDDKFSFQNEDCKYLHAPVDDLYPESGRGTVINGNGKLAQIQNWGNMPYNERVIWEVSNNLNIKLAGHFSSKVIKDSLFLYKEIYNKMTIQRGDNKTGMVAVCVYKSAKKNNADESPKKIAELMDVDISSFNKCAKIYSGFFKEEEQVKSVDYVESYCNSIKLSFKMKKTVYKICKAIDTYNLMECFPQNTCLGVIFFICKEMKVPLNLKIICEQFQVSHVTISKIYKNIESRKQVIFSKAKELA